MYPVVALPRLLRVVRVLLLRVQVVLREASVVRRLGRASHGRPHGVPGTPAAVKASRQAICSAFLRVVPAP